ncbi:neutral/alkaline non-lysosomal ceramidase N-terminal domain-containing protein [Streptomyces sp. NPDC001970]
MHGEAAETGMMGYCAHHLAYNLSVVGFQNGTYRAVDGISESVAKGHEDLSAGTTSLGTGTLTNSSVNRSRTASDRSPAAARAAFPRAIDPAVTVLRFRQGDQDAGGEICRHATTSSRTESTRASRASA